MADRCFISTRRRRLLINTIIIDRQDSIFLMFPDIAFCTLCVRKAVSGSYIVQ